MAAARRAVDDAQQRTHREWAAQLEPRQELLPAPGVHADLATAPALASPNQQRAASVIEIALGKRKCFLDAQPGAPHDHDQAAQAPAVRSLASGTHDRDDLFDLRRIGRVAQTLIAWRVAGVEARQRRRRSTSTGTIEQRLRHDPSSGSLERTRLSAQRRPGAPSDGRLSLSTPSSGQSRSATAIGAASKGQRR
jgi:hypothetical protein